MNNPTIYRVIRKDDNKVRQFRDVRDAAMAVNGNTGALFVIKSDERGDRLLTFPKTVEYYTAIDLLNNG